MPIQANDRARRCGFTLVELTIVVLITGIMVAVAVPRFVDALSYHRAEAAAKRIEADLKWARQQALSNSAPQTVQFSPGTDDYTIPGMDDLDHTGQTYAVDLAAYPYSASLESATLGGDSNVQFDRYGQPDSGGTITVQSGPFQRTVTIDPDVGAATIP